MKKYDTLVYIGRFQPFHNGHLEVVKTALELCNTLIIIVGSANQPSTYKNPWSAAERIDMIWGAISDLADPRKGRVCIFSNRDTRYDDYSWANRIEGIVGPNRGKIGIIGHKKDESSFYLDMFPKWAVEEVPSFENINATSIREAFFTPEAILDDLNFEWIDTVVPPTISAFMASWWVEHDTFDKIIEEKQFTDLYQEPYKWLPYPVSFVMVDPVVVAKNHVLMVRRKGVRGNGLLALPGGHFDAGTDRDIISATLRELYEETSIPISEFELLDNKEDTQVFAAKGRSDIGRTISHATIFYLRNLVPVKAGSDAAEAMWVDLDILDSSECFEDHYEIIQELLGT